jgi:amidase
VQNKVSRTVGEFFHRYDLLVTPTTNGPAFPLGLYNANDPKWSLDSWVETLFSAHCFTPVFNLTGTPAISVPLAQTNSGLPIGTQLCAGMGNDGLLFQVAAQLEQEFPWQGRRPPIYAGEARAAPA